MGQEVKIELLCEKVDGACGLAKGINQAFWSHLDLFHGENGLHLGHPFCFRLCLLLFSRFACIASENQVLRC